MVGLIYGLSGVSFGKTLPFTRAALERDYEITYYRPQDLLPKILTPPKDGPKAPAGKKPDVKPPKGKHSVPSNSRPSSRHRYKLITKAKRLSSRARHSF